MPCKDQTNQQEVPIEEELALELAMPEEEHSLEVPHADLPELQEYPNLPDLYEKY